MSQNAYQPKLEPKLPVSIHNIISTFYTLLVTLFRAIYWLFIGIKWLFAPIMLVLNFFLIIPYGKFFIKLPLALETSVVDENKLPDCIWWHFKEVSLELMRDGFEVGSYIEIRNLAPNMNSFFMSMINHETKQGAGVIVTVSKKVKLDGNDLPPASIHSIEFTTYCGNQIIVDVTSHPTPDPFPFLNNRQRLFVYDLSARGLYKLFDQFEKNMDCELPTSTISQLSDNPATIIKFEYLMLASHALKQNFVKKTSGNYAMTWKGAATNGLRTVWPTSSWYKYKDQKKLTAVFEQSGMEGKEYWEYEPELAVYHRLLEPLFPLEQAYKHSTFLLNEYLITPIQLVSIDITAPEKQYPSFNFNFRTIEKYPERKAASYGLAEVTIDNTDNQYSIDIDGIGLVSAENFGLDDDLELQPLKESLSSYVGYKKALEVIYQHKGYIQMEQKIVITEMHLAIENGQPLWTVYPEVNGDSADEIVIHAETGEIIS